MEENNYCRLILDWHYKQDFVDISMFAYVQQAPWNFWHSSLTKPQYSQHKPYSPKYGRAIHYAISKEDTLLLDMKGTRDLQLVVGKSLYLSYSIENMFHVTLINILT